MSEKRIQIRRLLIFVLPFLSGTYGLWRLEHESLWDAMFLSICMYLMNYGDSAPNLFVEIARWSAPLMTAGGIVLAISALRTRWHNYLKYLRGGSVAVYGDTKDTDDVLAELGSRGIAGGDSFVAASRYILLGDETFNISFYQANRRRLEGKPVCFKCSSLRAQTSIGGDLKLFSPYETAARLFWKQAGLAETIRQKGSDLTIAVIGFGTLGEELITWGLLDNIFSPSQKLSYHIFGGGTEFSCMHHELSSITDPVFFHDEPWYASVPLLKETDRIVVCEQKEQTELLRDLLSTLPGQTFDVFLSEDTPLEFFEEQDRLFAFCWKDEALKLKNLLEDHLIELAKRINLRYAHLYNGAEETDAVKEAEWKKLDSFTRYSNISSADYHEIRLQMLRDWNLPADYAALPKDRLELLAELEHIRWCRYHYLNNWSFGIPENGAAKDKKKRIHHDLIPYDRLTEAEKQKDRETIRTLMSVDVSGL